MDADCASSSNTNYTFNQFHPPQSYCFPKRSLGKKNVVLRSCQSTWFSKWRSKFWLRKLSDAISEHVFFKNFLGGHAPRPPSISMLHMLSALCTLLFNSHTLGRTYQKLLPPPLKTQSLITRYPSIKKKLSLVCTIYSIGNFDKLKNKFAKVFFINI